MEKPLNILLLEDEQEDRRVILHYLNKADFQFTLLEAQTETAFLEHLSADLDLILADYYLVDFNALDMLQHLQALQLDIPLIVITSALEETAIACMRQGAADYLLKDRLARLEEAIRRALDERQLRQEKAMMEAMLAEREELYRVLFEEVPIGLGIADFEGRLVAYNEAMLEPGGYTPQDAAQIELVEELYCSIEERDLILRLARERGSVFRYPTRFKRKDGSCYDALLSLRPITLSGTPHWLAMVEDATLRKSLEEQEERYRSLFDNMPVGVYRLSFQGKIMEANPAFAEMLGYPNSELLLNKPVEAFLVDPDQRYVWQAEVAEKGEVRNFQCELHHRAGHTIWVEDNSRAIVAENGRIRYFEGALLNITERKRAELARQMAEQRRRQVEETLRQAAAILNSTLSLEEVLSRILEQLAKVIPYHSGSVQRIENEVLVLKAVRGFEEPAQLLNIEIPIDPKYPNAEIVKKQVPVALEDIVQLYPHFHAEADKYQTDRIHSWLGIPLVANERTIGVITLDRNEIDPYTEEEIDLAVAFAHHAAIAMENARWYESLESYSLTLEKLVEERTAVLQRTTEQVEAILFNSPDAILLLDEEGRIEMGNPTLHELFGYQAHELQQQKPHRLLTPEGTSRFESALHAVTYNGRKVRLEIVAQRRDGTTFDADLALAPIQKEGHFAGLVCSWRDITPLKEVERMKDIFVSNVSHELRTPIAALRLNHYLLDRNPSDQQKKDKYMMRLGEGIERLNVLIEDLLRLSRLDQGQGELNLELIDLNELVNQVVAERIELAASKGLDLQLGPEGQTSRVQADEGLLVQVLSILLTNAFNYTSSGDKVILEVRQQEMNEKKWFGLAVLDTGPGIPDDEIGHLFDRFFRGNIGLESGSSGTGLGLSIAQEIVKRHHGWIEVYNRPEGGACFIVWLPVPEEEGQSQHWLFGKTVE